MKDKLDAHQLLAQRNLPIPRTMLVRFPVDPELVAAQIGFPCVVKLLVGSYGEGIYLSRDPGSFRDLMELVSSLDRTQPLILQEYIATRPGEDLRVWVVGGRVLGAMRRRSTDGSFKANISRGGDGEPFPLNSAIEDLALASASAVNLEIAGVDLLFDGDGYSVCEVNSAPGFAGFEQATGLNVAREILEHCCSRNEPQHQQDPLPAAIKAWAIASAAGDFRLTKQPIEVVTHHRFFLTALLKQEASQG